MPLFTPDQELTDLAKSIIASRRPNLKFVNIAYLFRDAGALSDEKIVPGTCTRCDDRNHVLHGHDFVIEIAEDVWKEATDQFKLAIMDHQLGHVGIKFDPEGRPMMDETTSRIKTYVRKHDIEEFSDVLETHGAYHKALREFLDAFARRQVDKKAKKSPIISP